MIVNNIKNYHQNTKSLSPIGKTNNNIILTQKINSPKIQLQYIQFQKTPKATSNQFFNEKIALLDENVKLSKCITELKQHLEQIQLDFNLIQNKVQNDQIVIKQKNKQINIQMSQINQLLDKCNNQKSFIQQQQNEFNLLKQQKNENQQTTLLEQLQNYNNKLQNKLDIQTQEIQKFNQQIEEKNKIIEQLQTDNNNFEKIIKFTSEKQQDCLSQIHFQSQQQDQEYDYSSQQIQKYKQINVFQDKSNQDSEFAEGSRTQLQQIKEEDIQYNSLDTQLSNDRQLIYWQQSYQYVDQLLKQKNEQIKFMKKQIKQNQYQEQLKNQVQNYEQLQNQLYEKDILITDQKQEIYRLQCELIQIMNIMAEQKSIINNNSKSISEYQNSTNQILTNMTNTVEIDQLQDISLFKKKQENDNFYV